MKVMREMKRGGKKEPGKDDGGDGRNDRGGGGEQAS